MPSHVCWTITKWAQQDDDNVQSIYINGAKVSTDQFHNDQDGISLSEGYWRVGHWNGARADMDTRGKGKPQPGASQ